MSGGYTKLADPTVGPLTPIGVAANPIRVDPTGTTAQPVSASSLPLPTGAATEANQELEILELEGLGATTALIQSQINSIAQDITGPNGTTLDDLKYRGSTVAVTSVADTATSTTLLAANVNRLRASIVNDSTAALYVLEGAGTASATNYSHVLFQYDELVVDDSTAILVGVWATDPNTGAARITSVTA